MPDEIHPEVLRGRLRYDPHTGNLFWRYFDGMSKRWNSRWAGKSAFTAKSHGHHYGVISGRNYYAHRVIWAMQTGKWPECQIDHINGDRCDNRWDNLRTATHSQNGMNRGPQKNNTSGYKGVYFHRQSGKWCARIKAGELNVSLGLHETAEMAAEAYRMAAEEMHGEFANAI